MSRSLDLSTPDALIQNRESCSFVHHPDEEVGEGTGQERIVRDTGRGLTPEGTRKRGRNTGARTPL